MNKRDYSWIIPEIISDSYLSNYVAFYKYYIICICEDLITNV